MNFIMNFEIYDENWQRMGNLVWNPDEDKIQAKLKDKPTEKTIKTLCPKMKSIEEMWRVLNE